MFYANKAKHGWHNDLTLARIARIQKLLTPERGYTVKVRPDSSTILISFPSRNRLVIFYFLLPLLVVLRKRSLKSVKAQCSISEYLKIEATICNFQNQNY